ncbi:hypothetical protein IHV10_19740 [Fictibacillus sp. 5RED26]|uniref:hypothetical protein n=1 Tax=Fictibacillus sp. 5RED26 TaxID=2745876 RepID=UPI0018CF5989|nr:hypothetical protein [Fictibacillus sp. 5RED26]MBH0158620.1 hypothetical protein [Fictibacillus sp. 5RED26]
MERKVELNSIIKKLIIKYEQNHIKSTVVFYKVGESYIFKDINQELLEELGLKKGEIIGEKLNFFDVNQKFVEKLKKLYDTAWGGKEVIYFCDSLVHYDSILVIFLEPHQEGGQVNEVIGHGVPIKKKDLQQILEMPSAIEIFEGITIFPKWKL